MLAESEIINLVSAGTSVEDIMRGIYDSLAERAATLLRRVGLGNEVTFIGGVARQAGMVKAIEDRLKVKARFPRLRLRVRVGRRPARVEAPGGQERGGRGGGELAMRIDGGHGYRLMATGQPLEFCELPALEPGPEEVLIQVAGCGVCHTDIGFAYDGVPTRHPLPLILGHEIGGASWWRGNAGKWMGRVVIVPAVIPCGACPACPRPSHHLPQAVHAGQ